MKEVRVIPVLLLKNGGLVKSVKFKDHRYVGDPINAVRIFNEKEVDELAIIDISATGAGKEPDYNSIAEIAGEAFMPVSYGGGITKMEQVSRLFFLGVEKIVVNKAAHTHAFLLNEVASAYGQQSLVVSIDVKKNFWGKYRVWTDNGRKDTGIDPVSFAQSCAKNGAGEILLNSIDKDGTYAGYDLELTKAVSNAVDIPLIICGGAGSLDHFRKASEYGASAVAAGSMFVFQRPYNAVLISYPSRKELISTFS